MRPEEVDLSASAIKAWLESLPADTIVYQPETEENADAYPCQQCVVATYLQSLGFKDAWVSCGGFWKPEHIPTLNTIRPQDDETGDLVGAFDARMSGQTPLTAAQALEIYAEWEQGREAA